MSIYSKNTSLKTIVTWGLCLLGVGIILIFLKVLWKNNRLSSVKPSTIQDPVKPRSIQELEAEFKELKRTLSEAIDVPRPQNIEDFLNMNLADMKRTTWSDPGQRFSKDNKFIVFAPLAFFNAIPIDNSNALRVGLKIAEFVKKFNSTDNIDEITGSTAPFYRSSALLFEMYIYHNCAFDEGVVPVEDYLQHVGQFATSFSPGILVDLRTLIVRAVVLKYVKNYDENYKCDRGSINSTLNKINAWLNYAMHGRNPLKPAEEAKTPSNWGMGVDYMSPLELILFNFFVEHLPTESIDQDRLREARDAPHEAIDSAGVHNIGAPGLPKT